MFNWIEFGTGYFEVETGMKKKRISHTLIYLMFWLESLNFTYNFHLGNNLKQYQGTSQISTQIRYCFECAKIQKRVFHRIQWFCSQATQFGQWKPLNSLNLRKILAQFSCLTKYVHWRIMMRAVLHWPAANEACKR